MKKLYFLLFSLFLLAACSKPPVLHDTAGNEIQLANYRGKWIVINYWATWCKPCFNEMTELNKFYQAHQNKQAVIFGVNYDYVAKDELPAMIKRIGAEFPTLTSDPAKILGIERPVNLPATVLISPDGRFQEVLLGEQTKAALEKAMGLKSK